MNSHTQHTQIYNIIVNENNLIDRTVIFFLLLILIGTFAKNQMVSKIEYVELSLNEKLS